MLTFQGVQLLHFILYCAGILRDVLTRLEKVPLLHATGEFTTSAAI